jgi:hypothetical protein
LLESLLGDVLGGARVGRYGHRDAEDNPLEPAHERDRKVGVPGAKAREQRFVGQPLAWRSLSPDPPHTFMYGRASDMDWVPAD